MLRACYKAYQSGFDVDLSDVNLDQLMNRSRSLSPHNVKKLREMRNANVQLPSIFDKERISEGSKGVVTILSSESLSSKKRFLNQYGGCISTYNDGEYDGLSALLGRLQKHILPGNSIVDYFARHGSEGSGKWCC